MRNDVMDKMREKDKEESRLKGNHTNASNSSSRRDRCYANVSDASGDS